MIDAIGTKTAIKVFSILLENPHKEFKEIELIKKSGVGKGAGAEAINKLSIYNMIKIKKVGKTKSILLNIINPLAFNLRQLLDYGRFLSLPESKISAVLFFKEKAYEDSKAIILFGSLSAGTYTEKSDIDLLIFSDREKAINTARKEISDITGEKLNTHFVKRAYAKKEFKENDLVKNAIVGGIIIHGGSYIREIIRQQEDLKELKFIRERISAAWRNYSNKDYESVKEILSAIREDMAFLACKTEGLDALSRKDAISKIKKLDEYKALFNMNKLNIENQLDAVEDIYMKLFNKTILRGEGIERRIEK